MNAIQLLERLNDQGIRVSINGTNLLVRGPAKAITPDLSEELRLRKQELLKELAPKRDGTDLQREAYMARDERDIVDQRTKAVELQTWLTDHLSEHMSGEPSGSPEWMSALVEFGIVEHSHLRGILHFADCIHEDGICPPMAPIACTACSESCEWRGN